MSPLIINNLLTLGMEPFSTIRTQRTERNGMDRSLTKNTKNGKERNVDGTIGKRTNENGTISLEALVLERNKTI